VSESEAKVLGDTFEEAQKKRKIALQLKMKMRSFIVLFVVARLMRKNMKVLMVCVGSAGMII